jgi:CubicO group peptidase (beta-lactamase class C family)
MKRKIITALIAAALLPVFAFTFAASSESDNYISDIQSVSLADSVFSKMSIEEKILQLYIFDARDNNPALLDKMPSGVLYNAESFNGLKTDVEFFSQKSDVPLFNICDISKPLSGLPNYMNPYAVSASDKDQTVLKNFCTLIADTLKTIGINAVSGNFSKQVPLNSMSGFSVKKFFNSEDLKEILLSDSGLVMSGMKPENLVSEVKKLLEKDKKKLLVNAIDEKVLRILRKKYQYPSESVFKENISKKQAAILAALKSITCVKNDSKFLPIKDLKDLTVIQIGGLRQAGFLSRMSSYCKPNYYYCNPTVLETEGVIKENSKKNVIFLINCKLDNKEIISLLRPVLKNGHSCAVNIDYEENLKLIDGKSVLQVFGNGYLAGDIAAQAVFGGVKVCGKFPLSNFENIKKGTSVTLLPTRLQYLQNESFNKNYCDTIDSIINFAILNRCFPGCQVFVCKDNKVLVNKAFGYFTYDIDSKPVNTDDIYDIASLTKISAATILAMYLTGEKLLDTKEKLGKYFDKPIDWTKVAKVPKKTVYDVSVQSILEHRSGISPNVPIYRYSYSPYAVRRYVKEYNMNIDSISDSDLERIIFNEYYSDHFIKDSAEIRVSENLWLRNNYADTIYNSIMQLKVSDKKPYKYSDVNMILLQMAGENILKRKSDEFLTEKFYAPLGMKNTCYTPYKYFNNYKIAPTEKNGWTGKYICGDVHDPSAALLGGVSGNAGLFSSAQDLGILFQMLLNKGVYGGQRYLDSLTVKKFTSRQPSTGRALGFDMAPSKYAAISAPPSTYGHTGFTGTCAWTDPENNIVIVFLSNRVYPEASNQKINTLKIRQKICQAVYDGLGI